MSHGDFNINAKTETAHGGLKTINATPTLNTHAVNKEYVDDNINNLDVKASCRVVVPDNVNIDISSAPTTIDSTNLNNGDRVLIRSQTNKPENGIYIYNGAGNALTRALDANSASELSRGSFTHIE